VAKFKIYPQVDHTYRKSGLLCLRHDFTSSRISKSNSHRPEPPVKNPTLLYSLSKLPSPFTTITLNKMPPLKWIPLVLVVALGCTAAWFAVHPAIIALDASEPNFCAMTFMWPTFLPIDMTSRSRWAHKYQLLFYKDSFTEVANTQVRVVKLMPS
jgi:hypothetical protein